MDTSNTRTRSETETEIQMPEPTPKRKRGKSAKATVTKAPGTPSSAAASSPLAAVPIADLRRAFGRLATIADPKSTMPMLHRVRVVADGGIVRLAATDLDTAMFVDVNAQTEAHVAVTLECRRMRDLLRVLPDGDVTLAYERGAFAELASGRCTAKVDAVPAADFPAIPEHDDEWHTIDAGVLRGMIDDVLPTVCHDDTRFHLNGAFLESLDGERVRMVSTDGHRLTKSQRFTATSFVTRTDKHTVGGIIVSEHALKELRKNLSDDGMVKIALSDTKAHGRRLFVKQGEWTLVTKPIDAQFPPYEQVIPAEHKILVTCDKGALIEACKRSKVFASETRGVRLTLKKSMLAIQSDDPDAGELVETVDADYSAKGEGMVYGISAVYFRAALEAMEGDSVVIALSNELDPILVRSIDDAAMRKLSDAELLVVVMPMRV